MDATVQKGGTLRTTWALYVPPDSGDPTVLADPDEFPEGPRFEVWPVGGSAALDGFTDLPFTRRTSPGIFSFNLPIPFSDGLLDPGDYEIHVVQASQASQALVGPSGSAPVPTFSVVAGASAFSGERYYVDPQELAARFDLPDASEAEVRYAQQLCDDWMHRSLWPTVIEKERHEVPPDRNLIQLDVVPVLRLYAIQPGASPEAAAMTGRYGYGRRDRRRGNQLGYSYLATIISVGSPAKFFPIDPSITDVHLETGQVWLPVGPLLVAYTQVECTYEAGFRVIPEAAKWAVAETIAYRRIKGFGPITRYQQGRVQQTMGNSLLTPEVQRRLEPYRVQTLR